MWHGEKAARQSTARRDRPPENGAQIEFSAGPPTSSMVAVGADNSGSTVQLNWAGSDDAGGSGIASCDINSSENGGPFVQLLDDTTLTATSFAGTGVPHFHAIV